mgnify:CR=1 FL=1
MHAIPAAVLAQLPDLSDLPAPAAAAVEALLARRPADRPADLERWASTLGPLAESIHMLLKLLRDEFEVTMALAGCFNLADIGRHTLLERTNRC